MHSNHTFNLIISSSVCQLEFSNPRVTSNDFTTHKGSHKKKDDTAKAANFKNLLNFPDNNNDSNSETIDEGNEGVSNMSRLHPVADLNDPLSLTLIPTLRLNYWILSPPFPSKLNLLVTKDDKIPISMSTPASSILKVAGNEALTTLKAIEIVDEVPSDGNSTSIKNTAEKNTKNTKEQHSRIDELGVDINAMLEDLLNDPTSSPLRMHGDTSLSPLARRIHEIREENDQPVFSLPVVAPYPPQPVIPAQPENANRDDILNTSEYK